MPGQGRLGDKANVSADAHGCPACPHPAIGPAIQGSPNVNVNGRPALRVDDVGIHAACCGPNMWTAQAGSGTVFINGKKTHRLGDANKHCGGMGQLVEGSANVIVGDSGGGGGGSSSSSGGGGDGQGGGGGSGGGGSGSGGGGAGGNGASSGSGSSAAASSAAGQSAAPPSAPPSSEENAPPKHWAEFRFRDGGGRAIGGAQYKITLPNGSEVKGKLDSQGSARHEQLPPGGSDLELAEIDEARWSVDEIDAHQPADLSIATSGLDGGEAVKFEVFRLYRERSGEAVATIQAQLDGGGSAKASWTPSSIESPNGQFLFKASVGGAWRKSAPMTVRQGVTSIDWSGGQAHDGEQVTLRAQLQGVRDGERATIKIVQKHWRGAQDADAQQLSASVSGGAIQAQWTVPAPAAPPPRGDSGRRDYYFTVEAGGLHFTSGLMAVFPREANR